MGKPPTNRQIRELLTGLGFRERESVEPKCVVYEHPESGARLLVPANKEDETARAADVLSVRTHLQYRGYLDEESFERFVEQGVLPAT